MTIYMWLLKYCESRSQSPRQIFPDLKWRARVILVEL